MKMFYEKDADVDLIKNKKIAIFGYGSQGHAHALNLKDSGVKEIVVALRDGSSSKAKRWSKEDFPDPDGPTRAIRSPDLIFRFKLLKRVIFPLTCLYVFFKLIVSNKMLFIF